MVRYIIKFIEVMHSDRDPHQISLGFALGMVLGLTPINSLHNLLVLLALLFFRVNISAALLSWMLFSVLAFVMDPLFHLFGLFLLTDVDALQGFWTALYNAPLIPYTRFNNSIVMGSLIFSLLAFFPVYLGSHIMVVKYRETIMERLNRWKILQVIKASGPYRWHTRYSELRG